MPGQLGLKELLAHHTMAGARELGLPQEGAAVRCKACCNRCVINEGESGICRVRFNRHGELRVPGGYVAGLQVDPIEKKPFFHVFPGSEALSFGMLGCNFHCSFCQNWLSSQVLRDERSSAAPQEISAQEIVALGAQRRVPVVVSTYNEPLITSEWAFKVFELARSEGMSCGFVSNGYATLEVLEYLRPVMDLYKVDLKAFSEARYRELGGSLREVLDAIVRIKTMGFWIEIVTLIVPGFNDEPEQVRGIAQFIAGISPDIPWHVTAFHPDYKATESNGTGPAALQPAYEEGKAAGLRYVYAGNLPGAMGSCESTFCPSCDEKLIERCGFRVYENRLEGGRCPACGEAIPGVWEGTGTPQ